MKTNVTISLDTEIVERLRLDGKMSSIINEMLQGRLFGGNSKESIQKAIDEKKEQMAELMTETDKLKDKLNKLPKHVVRYT